MASRTAASLARIHATPYARRLARERNLSLVGLAGSGPNGRITAVDLESRRPVGRTVEASLTSNALPLPSTSPVSAASPPSAIAVDIEFAAADVLLAEINALRTDIGREDICLKAAAGALEHASPGTGDSDILLMTGSSQRQLLSGVGQASLGAIASMRSDLTKGGEGGSLAVSFLSRVGIRPVAAQLAGEVPLRLVIGLPDKTGLADCLLSYDASKITDEMAEEFLTTFRGLIETPLRLLV